MKPAVPRLWVRIITEEDNEQSELTVPFDFERLWVLIIAEEVGE